MNSVSQIKLNRESLDEWLDHNKLYYKDLANVVGVSQGAISYYTSRNLPFPSSWVMKWQQTYAWSPDQVVRYCMQPMLHGNKEACYAEA